MGLFTRKSKWDRLMKAGRERYEQICTLARNASERFDASSARQRLETLAAQLDGYSSRTPSRRKPSA
jgi:hypothetical protein